MFLVLVILRRALELYEILLILRIILSYFPISPGSPLEAVGRFLYNVTEPVLAPIRRIMPPIGVGGMGLDLSPMIVLIILGILVNRL